MKRILFAIVSNDQYELPFIIGTFDECIKYTGEKSHTARTKISRHKINPESEWTGEHKWVRIKEKTNDDN